MDSVNGSPQGPHPDLEQNLAMLTQEITSLQHIVAHNQQIQQVIGDQGVAQMGSAAAHLATS